MIQTLTAPVAILADVVSHIFSALLLRSIATAEPLFEAPVEVAWRDNLREGFRPLHRHPTLRPIIWTSMGSEACSSGAMALFIVYATRELDLTPLIIGLIFAVGGVCAVPGSLLAAWSGRRFGVGRSIVWGWIIEASAWLLLPFAAGLAAIVVILLGLSRIIEGLTGTVANIHQWTLRQLVTPDHLHGRVTASHRFLVYGSSAVGALAGGALGSVMGLRLAIAVCVAGGLVVRLAALFTPLRTYTAGQISSTGTSHPTE